jgi:hypothetical protein
VEQVLKRAIQIILKSTVTICQFIIFNVICSEGDETPRPDSEEEARSKAVDNPNSKDYLFFGIPTFAEKKENSDSQIKSLRKRGSSFDFTK